MGSRLGATGGPTGGPTPGLDTPPPQVFSPTPPPQRASSGLLATNHGGGSPRDLLYDCSPGSAAHLWDSGSVRPAVRRQDSTGGPMSGLDDFSTESDENFSTATVNPMRGRWPEIPHEKSVPLAVKRNGNAITSHKRSIHLDRPPDVSRERTCVSFRPRKSFNG